MKPSGGMKVSIHLPRYLLCSLGGIRGGLTFAEKEVVVVGAVADVYLFSSGVFPVTRDYEALWGQFYFTLYISNHSLFLVFHLATPYYRLGLMIVLTPSSE